ncbi:MAG TPA: hypothetical protein VJ950_06990 [Acidimicrobiia bacterium]|jgi:hypothetical protein|nr:hypothetical protein [Acidimicrobiia bacterium]
MDDWKTGDERVVFGAAVVVGAVVVVVDVVVMIVEEVEDGATVVVTAATNVVGVGLESSWSNSNTRPVTPMTAAIRSSPLRFSGPGFPSW